MIVEQNVPLQAHNSFGIVAKARELVRVRSEQDVLQLLADPAHATRPKFVLGGGSNIVLTGDVKPLVLKVEVMACAWRCGPRRWWWKTCGEDGTHGERTWRWVRRPGELAMIQGSVGARRCRNRAYA